MFFFVFFFTKLFSDCYLDRCRPRPYRGPLRGQERVLQARLRHQGGLPREERGCPQEVGWWHHGLQGPAAYRQAREGSCQRHQGLRKHKRSIGRCCTYEWRTGLPKPDQGEINSLASAKMRIMNCFFGWDTNGLLDTPLNAKVF